MSMSQGGQSRSMGTGQQNPSGNQQSLMGSGQQSPSGSQTSQAGNQQLKSGKEILDFAKSAANQIYMPSKALNIEEIEKELKAFSAEDRELAYDFAKVGCKHVMSKDEYWKQQKEFPKNDPCCQVYKVCEFYNKPWFIYAAGGAAVFLAILISVVVTSVICCMMRKKKGGYTGGGGGKTTTKKSMKKSSKSKTKSKSKSKK